MTDKAFSHISFFGLPLSKLCASDQPTPAQNIPSSFHGLKSQNLTKLAQADLPIPFAASFPANFCHALSQDSGQKDTKIDQHYLSQTLDILAEAEHGANSKTVPLFLVARMSSSTSLSLNLPFVAGLGLNAHTVHLLADKIGVAAAHKCFQEFITQYTGLVWKVGDWEFEDLLFNYIDETGLGSQADFSQNHWQKLTQIYLDFVKAHPRAKVDDTIEVQSKRVLIALSKQWYSPVLKMFRKLHKISDNPAPAIIFQTMRFNSRATTELASGSGNTAIWFSRHPKNGRAGLYHQLNPETQGNTHCPDIIKIIDTKNRSVISAIKTMATKLEGLFHNGVRFNFVFQDDRVWLINAQPGQYEIHATIKIACDLVDEGVISKKEAVNCCNPSELSFLLHHSLKPMKKQPLLTGLPASLGASYGKIALDRHTALSMFHMGEKVILVRPETDPEDVYAIRSVAGVLTSQGGNSSHAAVIARSMGCPCVVGAKEMVFTSSETSANTLSFSIGEHVFRNGDYITIDGENGTVYGGKLPLQEPVFPKDLNRLLGWADELATMKVRANADSIEETECALNFGAQGIGLLRTEHMLLTPEALFHFRRVLLETQPAKKSAALNDILLDQKTKITEILHKMAGLPVTIRLLDPPLHEFLPKDNVEIEALATVLERPASELGEIVKSLEEKNPMLGHRGCRLAITLPELLDIQTRAILEAAKEVYLTNGGSKAMPLLEIMIPFVMLESEIELLVQRIQKLADDFCKAEKIDLRYHIGTMIEIPRAALHASAIAAHTDFFSFGTNDLTQTVWGLSRDDADSFLRDYYANSLLSFDPFKTLDIKGVGYMIAQACKAGKKANPDLHLGICGEHGADPASIKFFNTLGLDYVSCSPFQVPIARLAAGQAS